MQLLSRRKKIVILGGGCGGVVAATQLGRKLGADHDVILVDRRPNHIFMPAFLFVMIGERQPRDISRNLKILEKRDVHVIQSEILGIDPIRQEVSLEKEKINYDYLITSLGMQTRPDLVPGFAEASQHPWEMESALRLRESLESFRGGRVVVGVPLGPYRCPPALAGDLDCKIMCQDIGFLVRHAAGFGRRHVGAIANRVNVVPFGLQRVVIDANAGFALGKTAIEQHLRRPMRRHHDQEIVRNVIIVQSVDNLLLRVD